MKLIIRDCEDWAKLSLRKLYQLLTLASQLYSKLIQLTFSDMANYLNAQIESVQKRDILLLQEELSTHQGSPAESEKLYMKLLITEIIPGDTGSNPVSINFDYQPSQGDYR